MDQPLLIVLAGRPGTGKTTLARLLAAELGAAQLQTDAIAGALMRGGLTDEPQEAGRAAYDVAREVAAETLEAGTPVVVDGINASHERRALWGEVAERSGARLLRLETTLADACEHRRRVDERRSRGFGYLGPSWESIEAQPYDPWDDSLDGRRLVVEMAEAQPALAVILCCVGEPPAPAQA